MYRFAFLLTIAAAPASGEVAQGELQTWRNPATDYVTAGQDEPGYRSWYLASRRHQIAATSFNTYLATWGVSGIVPTWQLLRTATSWHRCGAQPFEVPPVSEWPHVVQTLRYINDYVIPAVGPVEAVSAYRNPTLNICAGGAPESAHKHYSAVDLVPLRPISREQLMRTLCSVHGRRGLDYGVGLGFYAFLRFHVDTTKYRRWGADPAVASCPTIIRPVDVATSAVPLAEPVAAATPPVQPVVAPAQASPAGSPAPNQAAGPAPQHR